MKTTKNNASVPMWRGSTPELFEQWMDSLGWPPEMELEQYLKSPRIPALDLEETKTAYIVRIDIPGMDKNDVTIHPRDHGLEILAHREEQTEDAHEGFHQRERTRAGYYRYFNLPADANAQKADAKLRNGTLRIHIPKSKEYKSPKTIEVN